LLSPWQNGFRAATQFRLSARGIDVSVQRAVSASPLKNSDLTLNMERVIALSAPTANGKA